VTGERDFYCFLIGGIVLIDKISNEFETSKDLFKTMQGIFHSSGDLRRHIKYNDICDVIIEHLIDIEKIDIEIKDNKKIFCDIGGGDEHKEIGRISMLYLIEKYGSNPKNEQWHYGKRCDIIDETNGIIIEVGDTNADDAYKHLIDKEVLCVIVVPFQQIISMKIYGYKITTQDRSRFIAFEENRRFETIKRTGNIFRNKNSSV